MKNMIFDSHAHYSDNAFSKDRDRILSGLKTNGVGYVVNASAAAADIPLIKELTEKYDFLYATSGLHPTELYTAESTDIVNRMRNSEDEAEIEGLSKLIVPAGDKEFSLIEDFLSEKKVLAVGEIGLDYHYEDTDKKLQKEWFERQIELAKSASAPIVIHSRDAAADTLDIVRATKANEIKGYVHCFSYEKEMAKIYMDMGYCLGIGGVITYKNARKLVEIVEYMPLDLMLLETDCPYLTPAPFRGERNDSTMIKYVAERVAQIKGIDAEKVIQITEENACRFYGMDQ